MCGIFAFLGSSYSLKDLIDHFERIKHRGPDKTHIDQLNGRLTFGFHRLAINGLELSGDQPMTKDNIAIICNGEIYNYRELQAHFGFKMSSASDCEIILHLYLLLGFEDTIKRLEGEFAIALYDQNTDTLYVGRDRFGVRGLLYGSPPDQPTEHLFASEATSLTGLTTEINHFPPGHFWSSEYNTFEPYFKLRPLPLVPKTTYEDATNKIYKLLTNSVHQRITTTQRPYCTLLSGGLDSTVVSYIIAKQSSEPSKVNAYTIGIEGSDTETAEGDLYYATLAAKEFGLNHIKITITEEEVRDIVPTIVKTIGSYDITTVRASIFNYLVCQAILKHNDKHVLDPTRDAVTFSAEFSDEIFNSYKGALRAPSPEAFYKENRRMVDECYLFDFLRGDRCISNASLEARLPFTDTKLVEFVMSLPPEYKMFTEHGKEKMLLRDAFKGQISDTLLYRPKEAFSDATGSKSRPPYVILQEHADTLYTDAQFATLSAKYADHNPPPNKEALWYREIFTSHYPQSDKTLLPHFWKQAFAETPTEDPSARTV